MKELAGIATMDMVFKAIDLNRDPISGRLLGSLGVKKYQRAIGGWLVTCGKVGMVCACEEHADEVAKALRVEIKNNR